MSRPPSVPTRLEGFDDLLDNVRDRIDEIESLHRTRENTVKEPVRVRS